MKWAANFLLRSTFLVCFTTAYAHSILAQSKQQPTPADTPFGQEHVFIVNDPTSEFYNRITDFSMDEHDSDSYQFALSETRKRSQTPFKKFARYNLPQNWVPVFSYKGQYYPYIHEKCCDGRIQINDSMFVIYNMDGPTPLVICTFSKISALHYRVTYSSSCHSTDIYIIDNKNKIAVFEDSYGNTNDKQPFLMIAASHIKGRPIIVNHSDQEKTPHLRNLAVMDKVDFEKIIENVKKKEKPLLSDYAK